MTETSEGHIAAADREIDYLVAQGEARGHCPHCLVAYAGFMRAAVRVRTAHAEAGLSAPGATACSLVGLANAVAYLLMNDLPVERHEHALAQFGAMVERIVTAPRAAAVDPTTH